MTNPEIPFSDEREDEYRNNYDEEMNEYFYIVQNKEKN